MLTYQRSEKLKGIAKAIKTNEEYKVDYWRKSLFPVAALNTHTVFRVFHCLVLH